MSIQLPRRTVLVGMGAVAAASALPSFASAATTHQVEMLNVHPDNPRIRQVFYPLIVTVEPGDSVEFVATQKSHNCASIDGMLPAGAEEWKGKINKPITVQFDMPGIYGYKCTPHYAAGMVGLVIVKGEGMLANLEEAQKVRHRGRAKKVFEEIWAQVEADGLLSA